MAYAGKQVILNSRHTGTIAFGSGDPGDVKADFAGAKLGHDLRENPEETLRNFRFNDYYDEGSEELDVVVAVLDK